MLWRRGVWPPTVSPGALSGSGLVFCGHLDTRVFCTWEIFVHSLSTRLERACTSVAPAEYRAFPFAISMVSNGVRKHCDSQNLALYHCARFFHMSRVAQSSHLQNLARSPNHPVSLLLGFAPTSLLQNLVMPPFYSSLTLTGWLLLDLLLESGTRACRFRTRPTTKPF